MLRNIARNVKLPYDCKRWCSVKKLDGLLDMWNEASETKDNNDKVTNLTNSLCGQYGSNTPRVISVNVLGSGAPGAPTSVLIYTERGSYLINCGEGTQRYMSGHAYKSLGLRNIFITRTNWKHIGGLAQIGVHLRDSVRCLSLHGPPKLKDAFSALRGFIDIRNLQVNYFQNGEFFQDSTLSVTSVPLKRIRTCCEQKNNDCVSSKDSLIQLNEKDPYGKQIDRFSHHEDLPSNEECLVMAYICKFKDQVQALNVNKCVALGAVSSKMITRLERGLNVILSNGKTISAVDVHDLNEPGPVVLFIDVPNRDFLQSLKTCTSFEEYQKDTPENMLDLVVHFTPNDIANTPEYQEFLIKFPKRANHWFLNESNKFSGLVASHQFQSTLNALHNKIFPMLGESVELLSKSKVYNSTQNINIADLYKIEAKLPNQEIPINEVKSKIKIDTVRSLTSFYLRPRTGLDQSKEANPNLFTRERFKPEVMKEIKAFNEMRKQKPINRNRDEEYPRFVFLGTGSAPSSALRNVSGILFHPKKNRSVVVDCGEGTANQIHRFYGSKADDIFRGIKCIAISHLHSDHHIGLLGILQERRRVLGDEIDPVWLFAPTTIESWLNTYNDCVQPIQHEYKLIANEKMVLNPTNNAGIMDVGLKSITTCEVDHCVTAFGFSFIVDSATSRTNEVKITYSGDTAPCDSLVALGYGSTVLIHESTFANNWSGNAPISKHSTDEDALEQGRKMNADFIILTHFSQTRKNIPLVKHDLTNAGIAVDNMEVTLSELDELTKMYPIMKKLF